MIFLSLGSNYGFVESLLMPFRIGRKKDIAELKDYLSNRYGGPARLYYRGRGALSAAVKLSANGGDVIVNGFTCYAVEEAVKDAGSRPIFADVEPSKYHFGLAQLEAAYKPSVKAVIIQNTFGVSCDIAAIESFCAKHRLSIIEDLAHSVGSYYPDGREVGTVGDVVMLSFGRDKHLDSVNGGALIVRKKQFKPPQQLTQIPPLKTRFLDRIYPSLTLDIRTFYGIGLGKALHKLESKLGLLSRSADGQVMSRYTMTATTSRRVLILFEQLPVDKMRRQTLLSIYAANEYGDRNLLRYPMLVADRDRLLTKLDKAGFKLRDYWYDYPIYPSRFKSKSAYLAGSCPNAEALAGSIINLPLHKNVSTDDARRIMEVIK